MIEKSISVAIDEQELLEYLQWHVMSGNLAFMPAPDSSVQSESRGSHEGIRYMSVTVLDNTTDTWQLIGYTADYNGFVAVILGRELYKNGPTELVQIHISGPTDRLVEPLQMLGLTHTPVYEVGGLANLWTNWYSAE